MYDNKLLECYFTRSFYKHILGKMVRVVDMESEDYSFYQGLIYLMEHNVADLGYELTFSTEVSISRSRLKILPVWKYITRKVIWGLGFYILAKENSGLKIKINEKITFYMKRTSKNVHKKYGVWKYITKKVISGLRFYMLLEGRNLFIDTIFHREQEIFFPPALKGYWLRNNKNT